MTQSYVVGCFPVSCVLNEIPEWSRMRNGSMWARRKRSVGEGVHVSLEYQSCRLFTTLYRLKILTGGVCKYSWVDRCLLQAPSSRLLELFAYPLWTDSERSYLRDCPVAVTPYSICELSCVPLYRTAWMPAHINEVDRCLHWGVSEHDPEAWKKRASRRRSWSGIVMKRLTKRCDRNENTQPESLFPSMKLNLGLDWTGYE